MRFFDFRVLTLVSYMVVIIGRRITAFPATVNFPCYTSTMPPGKPTQHTIAKAASSNVKIVESLVGITGSSKFCKKKAILYTASVLQGT
jgi:hypothetical protein